jgi:hypothetical protein
MANICWKFTFIILFASRLNVVLALLVLLYGSETWTIKARDARRITAAEMK